MASGVLIQEFFSVDKIVLGEHKVQVDAVSYSKQSSIISVIAIHSYPLG